MIGATISHYKILEKLGEGGMGVVYKAHDTKLDRTVALKFLPPHLTQSEEDKQRFIREAKAAAALNHPHICTVYSVEEHEGSQFISMEYIDGVTLRQRSETPAPENRFLTTTMDYAIQIAEALSEAHDKGIVHRDIKPENIMVDSKNRIKVMDFGLAKLKGTGNLTKAGSTVGTMAYMSPEQIQGEDVDHRSDIFSFGVVLYEMLTGQTPFRGEHEAAMVYSIANEDPQPLSAFLPYASLQLVNLLERALEKDAEERFQSMEDLLSDLKRLKRKSSKKHTAPISRSESNTRASEEHKKSTGKAFPVSRFPVIYGLTVLVLVVAVTASYFIFFSEETTEVTTLNPDRVVVAAFENRTGDSSFDPIGRLVSDWITQGIINNEIAEVIPSTTMLQLLEGVGMIGGGLEDRETLIDLAHSTESGILISGMFHQIGGDIQFHSQIIDVEKNDVILTLDPVRSSRSEPMKAIDELRQKIMGALAMYVYPGTDIRVIGDPPIYEAYVEYMEGTRYFGVDYERAFKHYRRAIDIDPDYMSPSLRMAVGFGNIGQYAVADSILQTIEQERHRLSTFDRYYLDWYAYRLQGKLEESFAALLHIESMSPMDATTNYLVGLFARNINRPRKTIETFAKIGLPEHWKGHVVLSWRFRVLGNAYHLLGEYQRELEVIYEAQQYFPDRLTHRLSEVGALAALGKIEEIYRVIEESKTIEATQGSVGSVVLSAARELHAHGNKVEALKISEKAIRWYKDNNPGNKSGLAEAFYLAERWEESYSLLIDLFTGNPDDIYYLGRLGTLAARKGNEQEARRIVDELKNIDREYLYGAHTYYCARIKALLGEKEEAVRLLEESFDQGRHFSTYVHRDIDLQVLRDYQPFIELLKPKG